MKRCHLILENFARLCFPDGAGKFWSCNTIFSPLKWRTEISFYVGSIKYQTISYQKPDEISKLANVYKIFTQCFTESKIFASFWCSLRGKNTKLHKLFYYEISFCQRRLSFYFHFLVRPHNHNIFEVSKLINK